jgi:DNA repair photolyase
MKISECTNRPILSPCSLGNFDYQIDPYIGCGHYCYYCYVLDQAETDWSEEIRIHKDIVGQLDAEIDKIPPQTIYLGYYTDPYQPCEAEYQQTRSVLKRLRAKGFSASMLTKSDLVLRDTDILQEMPNAHVSVSVAFDDNRVRQRFEADTIDTADRIEALRRLKAAGISTGALVCPVIPFITDAERLIDMLQPHADPIWIYGLSITDQQGPNWLNMQQILNRHYPDQVAQIEAAIFSKDHPYWIELRERLMAIEQARQLNLYIHV